MITRLGAALVGTLAMLGTAQAQELVKIDTIGDWGLYFSEALGDSCLASRTDVEGRQLQIGVDRKQNRAYVGVFATGDRGLTDGALQQVTFKVNGFEYSGEATEYVREDIQGGYVFFNNLNFAYDLAKGQTLEVMPAGGDAFSVDLTGSNAAIEHIIICQAATMQ